MSDLPTGWIQTTLGEIADTSLGKMLDRGKSQGNHLVPYLRNSNVQWGHIDLDDVVTMDIPPEKREFFGLRPGDLLVCEGGEIGRCAIWPGGPGYMAFQKALHRVRPYGSMPAKFILYLLEYMSNTGALLRFATGSTIKHLPQEQLRRLPVRLPPLGEQQRIVAVLDDHLSRLEAGGSLVKSLMTRSARLRKATLESAVRGIVDNKEIDFEDAIISVQNIRSSVRFDHRELYALPKGWTWVAAEEVCTTIACGGTPRAELMHSQHGDVPFIKVYNLTQRGHIDFTIRPTFIDTETHDGQLGRSKVFPGDVLTNIVGPPLGKTVVVPNSYPEWNINQAIVTFRAGRGLSPDWLALVLQAPSVLQRLKSTARATAGQFNIALSTCRALPIPLPPAAEQEQITETVRQVLYAVTSAERGINFCQAREGHLRRGLLAEALSGRLVPQDPRDEPASVLVERISAQRAAQPRVMRGGRKVKRAPQEETLL